MAGSKLNYKPFPTRIFVEGKSLKQIAEEAGLDESLVRCRYTKYGFRTIQQLSQPRRGIKKNVHKPIYNIISASEIVAEAMYAKGWSLTEMERNTGVSRSAIYKFVYEGTDISSSRLAKICRALGLSMDEVMYQIMRG